MAVFSCIPIIHLVMGILFITAPEQVGGKPGDMPPPLFGWMFAIMGGTAIIVGWIMAVCVAIAGKFLALKKHYMYCLIMACVSCFFMPFGTILGIFTIMALNKPTTKALFK